jgi:hypothetical protein
MYPNENLGVYRRIWTKLVRCGGDESAAIVELGSRNIDRGKMAPNCLSHSLTTLGLEGILL